MPIPASGAVTMLQIHTEYARGYDLGAYRGTGFYFTANASFSTFPSTNLSYGTFRGTQLTDPSPPPPPTGDGGDGGGGGP
jgi:hypothetical protein